MSSNTTRRVAVVGRSWESHEPGFYCFEAAIDGQPTELHVSEEVAFDFLKAWTPNSAKCLEILRLHRTDLARLLERKLRARAQPGPGGFYILTWGDLTTEDLRASGIHIVALEPEVQPEPIHGQFLKLIPIG